MKPFPIIILAGGEKGPLIEATEYSSKAELPICGKAMVEWVVDAFRKSPGAGDVVVVGPPALDILPSTSHLKKRVRSGGHVLKNLLRGMIYVRWAVHKLKLRHRGYVIASCDSVFLTPAIIDETLAAIDGTDADIVMTFVEKAVFEEAGLPAEHTYYAVGNRLFTGAAIYYIRSLRKVAKILPTWVRLRRNRKDGKKILEILGCQRDTPEAVAQALKEQFSLKVEFHLSRHPELGMDVDTPQDLELVRKIKGTPPDDGEPWGRPLVAEVV
jgi:GTP:adenosylcobinamide-phosphate guanylyltransferase